MIDLTTKFPFKCKLIDFGMIFHYRNFGLMETSKTVRTFMKNQNPFLWYYLFSKQSRQKFFDTYGKNETSLKIARNMGWNTQKYKVDTTFVDAVFSFKFNIFPNLNDTMIRLMTQIYTNISAGFSFSIMYEKYGKNEMKNKIENKLNVIWSCRIIQSNLLIKLLKQYDNDEKYNNNNLYKNMIGIAINLKDQIIFEMKQTQQNVVDCIKIDEKKEH